jgi:hypothetical protein
MGRLEPQLALQLPFQANLHLAREQLTLPYNRI